MESNNNQAWASRQNDQWANDRLSVLAPEHDWQPNTSRASRLLQQRREAQRTRGRKWAWAVVTITATGLPLIALPVTRSIAERCVSQCVKESGKVRDFFTGNAPGLKTAGRSMAPDFSATDVSGQLVKLSDFRGKVVVLNFWATWCGPCKAEIPMMNALQQKYGHRNFTVLGVSLEEDGWNVVKPYMQSAQFKYPVLVGREDVAALYHGLDSIPTTFVIDRSGHIAAVHVGLCGRSEYEAGLDALFK